MAQSTQLKEVKYLLEKILWGKFLYRATEEPKFDTAEFFSSANKTLTREQEPGNR